MKYTQSFVTGLLACGIALAMISTSVAQSTKNGAAKVVRIKGSARVSNGNGSWRPLKVGDVLPPGSAIQTQRDSGSYVDLVLADDDAPLAASGSAFATRVSSPGMGGLVRFQPSTQQNTVRVLENSLLGIDKLTATETGADLVSETQLDLKAGRIIGNVKKMSAASRYEIKLPNGVAGIRGTIYDITADGVIRVSSGSVVVSLVDAQGNVQTRVVMGGQEYNSKTDQTSPIGSETLRFMQNNVTQMEVSAVVPTTVTMDQTILFVSPTEGTAGNIGGDIPPGE